VKKVLIAHQSTIPHYRVPFYNNLENQRPEDWRFEVVYDPLDSILKRFFNESIDFGKIFFPVLPVKTLTFPIMGKKLTYQAFWRQAAGHDLVILENAVNNITYPLSQIHQIGGTKIAFWGHGKDRSVTRESFLKKVSERLKLWQVEKSHGFFAYTQGVKSYLVSKGIRPEKIFVVNNTIDIKDNRSTFFKFGKCRDEIRKELRVQGKKVLLFVGRLSGRFTQHRRVNFLLESFNILLSRGQDFHLLLVGSGGEEYLRNLPNNITYLGSLIEIDKIAPIYIASDVFVYPGSVGLGVLQALCYSLPVVTIDSPNHGPEIDYLTQENSIILNSGTTPQDFANHILNLFHDRERLEGLKSTIWPSIEYLSIENMAKNFIQGVNTILG
jgi:glycosyltransferase involved in cell wall biosynthesis